MAPKVIWTDEKIFALHMRVNKQNDRVWGVYNPREYRETKVNGDQKAMVWVGIVGGQILARDTFFVQNNSQILPDFSFPALIFDHRKL